MCDTYQPAGVADALVMLDRALDALNAADAGSLPVGTQAQVLRALGRAEAKHTAARAQMLAAFTAQDGYQDDGHGSARVWLKCRPGSPRAPRPGRWGGHGGWPRTQ